jgi:transposase
MAHAPPRGMKLGRAYPCRAGSEAPFPPWWSYLASEFGVGSANHGLLPGKCLSTRSRMFLPIPSLPRRRQEGCTMERIFGRSAGVDVHRDTVVVSIRKRGAGTRDSLETRTFETYDDSLREFAAWVSEAEVEALALESTGVYWKPVVRMLQRQAAKTTIWLVNPDHVKKVPGRKTDVSDSQWLSKLVMYGLVMPSFLALPDQEELRKLTRHRTKLVSDQVRCENRIHKELEASGVKLGSVCTNVLGKSGRAMIEALLAGVRDPKAIADLARGTLRKKIPILQRAVDSGFTPSCAFILRQLLSTFDRLDLDLAALDAQILRLVSASQEDVERLRAIPGVDQVAAAAVFAEMGGDMSLFSSAKKLSAWAGLSPGSNESAGKAKQAPTRKGDKYLRTILVQSAWAAVRTKTSIWRQKFARLVPRLGPKKAIVAIARHLLVAIYYMQRDKVPYAERPPVIAPDKRQQLLKRYTAQLAALGFDVHVTSAAPSDGTR